MTSTQPNPLRKHFRQPSIFLKLPSGGKFWGENNLFLPPNGEVPVMPMTAIDEITSRTPDALFNGSAVVEIIQSCVPGIHNAWATPTVDLNALLVAVRIASYGHSMPMESNCPKCNHVNELNIDLRVVLDQFKSADYDQKLKVGELVFSFKPMTYAQVNESNKLNFENQKVIQVVNDAEMPEDEKFHRLSEALKNITHISIRNIAEAISSITTTDMTVTETEHILEYLQNAPKAAFEKIREKVIELREPGEFKPIGVTCNECSNQYQQAFSLDISNFFETAS